MLRAVSVFRILNNSLMATTAMLGRIITVRVDHLVAFIVSTWCDRHKVLLRVHVRLFLSLDDFVETLS